MEDQKETQAGRTGAGLERQPSPGYDAPIIAPEITRDVLEVFETPVYVSRTYRDEQRVSYAIESRDPESYSGEIRVTRSEQADGDAVIEVDGTPAIGSGISMSISGPVSDWLLAQTVDDHNLLTELVYQGESVLSIYGPPAKLGPADIAVCGDNGSDLLIPAEHRR